MADSFDPTILDTSLQMRDGAHPNPMFDFLTGFVPRKLKDLFKWAEYLVFNSAQVYAVVKKFGEYPITKILYDTAIPGLLSLHKKIYEKHLKMRGFLTKASFDKYIYGNGFYSLYKPFKRFLICQSCHSSKDINYINYKFKKKNLEFRYHCSNCNQQVTGKIRDVKLKDPSLLRIIRWDPKLMDIEANPITGECVYYYTIPKTLFTALEKGNKTIINSMPYGFLEAMRDDKIFRFDKNAIYHMKVPGPAGVEAQWGFPPITAAIKLFLFTAILRKANEAIALEYITPFRVINPAPGTTDPLSTISMSRWRSELELNIKRWRRDPLHMMFAPTPIQVTNMGGDGRTLMVTGEIKDAQADIVTSMGVPMEFLTGGLAQNRGEISLRMLENQLQTHIEDLNDLLSWCEDEVSRFMGYTPCTVKLSDFKLIDDIERKQLLMQLWSQGKISDSTIAEMFELDLVAERGRILEDTLAQHKSQQEIESALRKLQTSLSSQVQQQAQAAGGINYNDAQSALAAADQMVQELLPLDEGTRRSRIDAIQGEDPVMHALVKERLEQAMQNQNTEIKQQNQPQAG
jgi:hypothetical protein